MGPLDDRPVGAQYGFGDTSNLVFQFQPFNFIMMCIVILIFIHLPSGIRGIYFPGISDARLYPTFQIQMGKPYYLPVLPSDYSTDLTQKWIVPVSG